MGDEDKGIDARLDVIERRVLALGATAEEWAIEVAQPIEGVWTTTFYVGVQSFRLAGGKDVEAEQHCMFIGRMFVKAIQSLLNAETRALRQAIVTANDLLFDSHVDDPEHQISGHADTLPQAFRQLAAGHGAAFETLQEVIREWVEPTPAVGLGRALRRLDPSEDVGDGVLRVAEIDDGTGASMYVMKEAKMDDKATAERFRTGVYRHYKGGAYTALGLVTHHDSRQLMVLYVSHTTGTLTIRPLKPTPVDPDAWDDWVEHDGKQVRRFAYLGPSGDKTPEAPAAAR